MPPLAVIVAAVSTFRAHPAPAAPPSKEDVARLVAQWEGRRQAVRVARYVVKWEWFPTNLKPGSPRPGEGGAFTGTGAVLIDFANRRLRADADELMLFTNFRPERLGRIRSSLRYDGVEQASLHRSDNDAATAPADAEMTLADIRPWDRSYVDWPVEAEPLLWSHGFLWPVGDAPRTEFPLDRVTRPDRFTPVGRETVDGRSCLVLRDEAGGPRTTVTFWADPGRAGAVVRRRVVYPSGLSQETTLTHRETSRGWFPAGWVNVHTRPGQPAALNRRVRVESAEYDGPAPVEEFRAGLRPGTDVTVGNKSFRVGPDGALMPPPVRPGLAPDSFRGRVARTAAAVGWWGPAGLGTAVVLGVILVRLRNRPRDFAGYDHPGLSDLDP